METQQVTVQFHGAKLSFSATRSTPATVPKSFLKNLTVRNKVLLAFEDTTPESKKVPTEVNNKENSKLRNVRDRRKKVSHPVTAVSTSTTTSSKIPATTVTVTSNTHNGIFATGTGSTTTAFASKANRPRTGILSLPADSRLRRTESAHSTQNIKAQQKAALRTDEGDIDVQCDRDLWAYVERLHCFAPFSPQLTHDTEVLQLLDVGDAGAPMRSYRPVSPPVVSAPPVEALPDPLPTLSGHRELSYVLPSISSSGDFSGGSSGSFLQIPNQFYLQQQQQPFAQRQYHYQPGAQLYPPLPSLPRIPHGTYAPLELPPPMLQPPTVAPVAGQPLLLGGPHSWGPSFCPSSSGGAHAANIHTAYGAAASLLSSSLSSSAGTGGRMARGIVPEATSAAAAAAAVVTPTAPGPTRSGQGEGEGEEEDLDCWIDSTIDQLRREYVANNLQVNRRLASLRRQLQTPAVRSEAVREIKRGERDKAALAKWAKIQSKRQKVTHVSSS